MTPAACLNAWHEALSPDHAARRRRMLAALAAGQGRRRLDARALRALLDMLAGGVGGVLRRAVMGGLVMAPPALSRGASPVPSPGGAMAGGGVPGPVPPGRMTPEHEPPEHEPPGRETSEHEPWAAGAWTTGAWTAGRAHAVSRRAAQAAAAFAPSMVSRHRAHDAMAAAARMAGGRRPVPRAAIVAVTHDAPAPPRAPTPASRPPGAPAATVPVGRGVLPQAEGPQDVGPLKGASGQGTAMGTVASAAMAAPDRRPAAAHAPAARSVGLHGVRAHLRDVPVPAARHVPGDGGRAGEGAATRAGIRTALRRAARQVAGGAGMPDPLASGAQVAQVQAHWARALDRQVELATAPPARMAAATTEIHMGDVVVHASSTDGQRIGAQVRDQLRRSVPALANTGQR